MPKKSEPKVDNVNVNIVRQRRLYAASLIAQQKLTYTEIAKLINKKFKLNDDNRMKLKHEYTVSNVAGVLWHMNKGNISGFNDEYKVIKAPKKKKIEDLTDTGKVTKVKKVKKILKKKASKKKKVKR